MRWCKLRGGVTADGGRHWATCILLSNLSTVVNSVTVST